MPFNMSGWSTAAASKPGAAPSIFTYRTTDTAADVDTAGYFDSVREQLRIGDLIYRVTVDGNGALVTAGFHTVKDKPASNAAGVDVTDTLALTVTDTD